jgi:hypothetical protein
MRASARQRADEREPSIPQHSTRRKRPWRNGGAGLLLTPHRTGTDGFFLAVLNEKE